jgi:peptidoglycan/xylan/chitin deacetylase (PgdA/CDA1 family)
LTAKLRRLYKNIYSSLPKSFQGEISKVVFKYSDKPSVKAKGNNYFPDGAKGGFVISADFELAWAWRYSKTSRQPFKLALEKAKQERENVPVFLKMFEEYNIPITWATVGHLFLESCKKGDHDWIKRIPHFNNHWLFEKGDWYDYDPCSDYKNAPEWYAPDLIEMILKSNVNHEIGSHSFSHLHFRDQVCPPDAADDDIKACIDIASKWGVELKSMVFPGGTNGNYQTLVKYGFTNYRLNSEYDLFYPEKDKLNLVRLPSSFSFEDMGFNWSKEYYIYRYKKYLDKAIETGTVCHGWFHPSEAPWIVNDVFPEVLKYAAQLREKGLLYIATMNDMSSLTSHKEQNVDRLNEQSQ